jgi:hypothetical protein
MFGNIWQTYVIIIYFRIIIPDTTEYKGVLSTLRINKMER